MRTDLTNEIDAAMSTRNQGARGFWEVARSGNGNMRTDLLEEDGYDYEELEGVGEAVEEMSLEESVAEDKGNRSIFKPYREALPGEQPPHAPKPGKGWIRRRIRMESRRPGGNRLVRVRWAQVSPAKMQEIRRKRQVQSGGVAGLGFMNVSSSNVMWLTAGAVAAAGLLFLLKRKKPRVITAA